MIKSLSLGSIDGIKFQLASSTTADKYTQEQLEAAFKLVQNKTHWKGPIRTVVLIDTDLDLVQAAVEHFTGTEADTVPVSGYNFSGFLVSSPGYWAGPCN